MPKKSYPFQIILILAVIAILIFASFENSRVVFATPDSWTTKASMFTIRKELALAAVGTKIYAISGFCGSGAVCGGSAIISNNEEYDTVSDTWTTKAPIPTKRMGAVGAAVNGKIYVIGGKKDEFSNWADTNERYDPVADTWASMASMPTKRYEPAAAVVNGKIYVIGGYSTLGVLDKNEVYDPVANNWATLAPMPTKRYGLTATAINGKIYVIGGYNLGYRDTNEMYDPTTDTWTSLAPMPIQGPGLPSTRYALSSAAYNNKIYVIGGMNALGPLDVNQMYDPVANSWAAKASMPTKRYWLAAVNANGKIYVIGGQGTGILATNEEYEGDAASPTPTLIPPPPASLRVNRPSPCRKAYPPVGLNWTYYWAGNQDAYQIQIDDASPPVDFISSLILDTGKIESGSQSFVFYDEDLAAPPNLSWDTLYYWRLRVWGNGNPNPGDWIYPPSNLDAPTAPPGTPFYTAAHQYPRVDFAPVPLNPAVGEVVTLDDSSTCYRNTTNASYACSGPNPNDGINNRYRWNFGNGALCNSQSNPACRGDATTSYAAAGPYTVRLTIKDDITGRGPSNAGCSWPQDLQVGAGAARRLEWREIIPF